MTELTHEQIVLVRHCNPIVLTASPSTVRLTIGRGWGEMSVLPPTPVSKRNNLIHLKLEIEIYTRIRLSGAFYVLKIHKPKFGSIWSKFTN